MPLLIFLLTMIFMTTLSTCAQNPPPPPIEPGVPQTLAKWRAKHYSDVRYKLNLTLEKGAPALKGTIEIVLQNSADRIVLDWRRIRGSEALSTVSNVSVNGAAAKFEEIGEHLVLTEGVKTGENSIRLDFTSPILTSGAAVTRYADKEDGGEYVYSLFVPSDASTAFPVFDQPDLKARFKLEVTSKTFDRVVSNAIGKTSDANTDTDKFTFAETEPISTYVFAFAAGDFVDFPENRPQNEKGESIKDLAMEGTKENFRVFVRRSQAEKFKPHEKEFFRLTREAVKNLESYFDYKFPFSKYDTILIPEFPFGGMEHAGATFLREASVIFPSEPTANDYVSRANLIFHEAAHQWFGDTVTMKWFDDLWLKEGFAEFMAYKTLAVVLPEYNAWKAFYERNKPLAYLTDSTRGTTPIYQEIPNLSAAKSAYGNIVYRKAPSFLRQAEFFLGEKEFQTAVRAFLKKHRFANAEWTDLLREFEAASGQNLKDWGESWIKQRGLPLVRINRLPETSGISYGFDLDQRSILADASSWNIAFNVLQVFENDQRELEKITLYQHSNLNKARSPVVDKILRPLENGVRLERSHESRKTLFLFPNYGDYGYGIFLLDAKSRDYVLKNIQNEKDAFLRSMMWGSLWDSVREAELNPKDYIALAVKNIAVETDELTIQTILSRAGTAINYYLSEAQAAQLAPQFEAVLLDRMTKSAKMGQRITFYRAYLNFASTPAARKVLKDVLAGRSKMAVFNLRTKDKFDIVTRLFVLNDPDAPRLLAGLEKTETGDDAKRYAYAARAGSPAGEMKAQYFRDFLKNAQISESWIEAAFGPFNSVRHAELTAPYLETALAELPNLKRSRKIFFVNGWLGAFLGGQKSEEALKTVNKFLEDNPNLDRDLKLKILENTDGLERAVRIREKFAK
jgi:aminopeptidase N